MSRLLTIGVISFLSSFLGSFTLPAAPGSEDEKIFTLLDACIDKFDASGDTRSGRLLEQCPRLLEELQRDIWQEWLPQSWQQSELSAGSLRELKALLDEALAVPATARAPRLSNATLERALQQVIPADDSAGNAWQQMRRWLRRFMKRQDESSENDAAGWLRQLTLRTGYSQTWIETLTTGAFLLVVILAIVIVFNELRVSGVLRRRRLSQKTVIGSSSVSKVTQSADGKSIDVIASTSALRVLLEQLTFALTATQRLPPARALTTQEMLRQVRLDAVELQSFQHLVLAVERSCYARTVSQDPPHVAEIVQNAKLLLQRLEQPL
jgi:hypothetical protein